MKGRDDGVARVFAVRTCRVCGCTDENCSGCVERTGRPCHWVERDLCSACKDGTAAPPAPAPVTRYVCSSAARCECAAVCSKGQPHAQFDGPLMCFDISPRVIGGRLVWDEETDT